MFIVRHRRLIARVCALAAAIVLMLPVLPWTPLIVPAVSPYVAAGSAVAARSVAPVTLLALPVMLLILLRRRWFCRWACPVGLLTECAGRISPVPKTWCEKLPPLGRWTVLATLAGACVGYPLLLWLDPLAMWAASFGLRAGPPTLIEWGIPAVLLLSFVLPGAWCRRVCPLGATQDLVALPGRFLQRSRRPAVADSAGSGDPRRSPIARRSLLAMVLGGAWTAAGIASARRILTRGGGASPRPLRPPGAVPEPRFFGLCIRCGNCVRACPAGILHADTNDSGVVGFMTPVVRIEEDYCREDCRRCMEVCPSGAIRRLSLEQKKKAPIGLARLELELCRLYDNHECSFCEKACPYGAIAFAWNEDEYIRSPRIDPALCPGCGACVLACPGTNDWEREHSEEPVPPRRALWIDPDRSATPRKDRNVSAGSAPATPSDPGGLPPGTGSEEGYRPSGL